MYETKYALFYPQSNYVYATRATYLIEWKIYSKKFNKYVNA